jgi:hypothetical protein
VTCVLTDMNAPIGRTIGNALEIAESIEVLRGGGPVDTRELTVVLGAEMLMLGRGRADSRRRGARRSRRSSTTARRWRCSARSSRPRAATRACAIRPAACCRSRRREELIVARASRPPRSVADGARHGGADAGRRPPHQGRRDRPRRWASCWRCVPGDRVEAGDLIATAWCDDDDALLDA